MQIRSFIAIEIPEAFKYKLKSAMNELDVPGVKPVFYRNLHLSLKFLGDITPDKLEQVKYKLSKISFRSFRIKLKKLGVFPSPDYIRVVWVGAESKQFLELSKKINDSLNDLFPLEEITPHITIARVKKKINLEKFLKKYSSIDLGSFKVDSFKIMQSILKKEGPEYIPIETFEAKV